MIEEEKKKLEHEKREFEKIRYAQEMRMREQAKRMQDQQNMLMRAQKMNQHKKAMYEKIEREKKEEEEKRNPKKSFLEDHCLLQMDDIKINKMIGQGGSAKVYKGLYKEIDVAIKRLDLKSISIGKAKQEFKREVNTLSKIRHPNLVLFMGVAIDQSNFCIITEF